MMAGDERPETSATPASPGQRILVVEDNTDSREMLRQLLEIDGYEVYDAPDGQAAIALARKVRPHIALIDLGLPDLNGYELAIRLRGEPQLKGMALIALTGYGAPEDRQRSRDAGFWSHLVKPIDPDMLRDVFAEVSRARGPSRDG
jgi:CheY-like chemotaxis protein